MRQPSPDFQGDDATSYPDALPVFIPDAGDRQATAAVLSEAADKAGLRRHIRSDAARRGFWISDALADVVYDEDDSEPEPAPKTPAKAPAKTGSTAKKGTKKS